MATPRRSVTKGRWTRGFTGAFLAMAAAVLLIAQPVLANPWELIIDVKDGKKVRKMVIMVDEAKDHVSATVDGKPVTVSEKKPFPVKLGEHCRTIGAIYPGPTIVFEGSYCVYFQGRWIGTPPCP